MIDNCEKIDIYEPLGYRDTARNLSYSQCESSITSLIARDGSLEDICWWERQLSFLIDQDDDYHIYRHYPELIKHNNEWYKPFDIYDRL